MQAVDAHAHIWRAEDTWLDWLDDAFFDPVRRDFSLAELTERMDSVGIQDVILVHAATDVRESVGLLSTAATAARVAGVVGWVSLASGSATQRGLDQLGPSSRLVGVRHLDGWAPDGRVIAQRRARESVSLLAERGLILDVQMRDGEIVPEICFLASSVPGLRVVIDHMGQPALTDPGAFAAWANKMAPLAELPNISVKFSGWATRLPRPDPDFVRKYTAYLIDHFTDERIIFASNWPVALLGASYQDTYSASIEALGEIGDTSTERILSGNARRIYRLGR
jgi:L-fuconolactonase